ncbi:hypothetical protein [Sphingobacterium pedocola]|uniref:Lipoprotein n=1 Tax=Sphingobacterium pedocola TaxID=2082722 RepID=A0ABR9T2Q0_9SPHI|nr:hypothetical protein [Sphingobacterium pedocola]MBE8719615.1 hypothetical protein [Sphingobacterium pedocola]
MKKLFSILCLFSSGLTLSCGGCSSGRSADDKQDTVSTILNNSVVQIDVYDPYSKDEYLQRRIAEGKKVLEKQLWEGANIYNDVTDIPKEPFDTDELRAVTFELFNVLWDNGYRDVEKMTFVKKVKEIFGIQLPTDTSEQFRYVNLLEEDCTYKPIYYRNNGIDYNGFFIVTPGNFITDFYYLPEIIDYRSQHSDLAQIEKKLPTTYWSTAHKADVNREKWNDLENRTDEYNLEQQRKFNRLLILNRNRFLFKNENTRLQWLMEYDRFFMESLVKRFGWTAHDDLLYQVVLKTPFEKVHPDAFGSLFWKWNCGGSITIHANTFKLLQKRYVPTATSEIRGLLSDIQSYLEYMMGYAAYEPRVAITDRQRVEILANMVYFAEQYKYTKRDNSLQLSDHRMMGRLRLMLNEKERTILQDNHYFGLQKFREWWDAADYDEYYVDGEYNGPWGRDNEPMTESEWREGGAN